MDEYEYRTINVAKKVSIHSVANKWAEDGWRTVAVMPSQVPGYDDAILIERKRMPVAIQVPYKGETLTFPWVEVTRYYSD